MLIVCRSSVVCVCVCVCVQTEGATSRQNPWPLFLLRFARVCEAASGLARSQSLKERRFRTITDEIYSQGGELFA